MLSRLRVYRHKICRAVFAAFVVLSLGIPRSGSAVAIAAEEAQPVPAAAVAPEAPPAVASAPVKAAAVEVSAPSVPAAETAGPVKKPHSTGDAKDKDYVIQTGDRIKITIYPEDDHIKGGEMEVSSEGNITLSLAGKMEVVGKTAIQAEREIAEVLDRDYLVNPEVVIEVVEKFASDKEKSVVLLGQVKSPGSHPFPKTGHFTLLQAIAVAGGFADVANIKKIKIIRGGEDKGDVIRANADDIISGKKPDIELQDGDIINVAESLF